MTTIYSIPGSPEKGALRISECRLSENADPVALLRSVDPTIPSPTIPVVTMPGCDPMNMEATWVSGDGTREIVLPLAVVKE